MPNKPKNQPKTTENHTFKLKSIRNKPLAISHPPYAIRTHRHRPPPHPDLRLIRPGFHNRASRSQTFHCPTSQIQNRQTNPRNSPGRTSNETFFRTTHQKIRDPHNGRDLNLGNSPHRNRNHASALTLRSIRTLPLEQKRNLSSHIHTDFSSLARSGR